MYTAPIQTAVTCRPVPPSGPSAIAEALRAIPAQEKRLVYQTMNWWKATAPHTAGQLHDSPCSCLT